MQMAPKVIATELIRAAAAASGKASMRQEPNGAISSKGYAGNIQIGVIVWIGNVLACGQKCRNQLGVHSLR
jgi:hypothetical protein